MSIRPCKECNSKLIKYEAWFKGILVEGWVCQNCGWGYTQGENYIMNHLV